MKIFGLILQVVIKNVYYAIIQLTTVYHAQIVPFALNVVTINSFKVIQNNA